MNAEDLFIKKLEDISSPETIKIECKTFDLDFIVKEIEQDKNKKDFYAEIFEWFLSVMGKPGVKSFLNIDDDEIRKARFGEIDKLDIKKSLIKYLAGSALGFLLNVAKKNLSDRNYEFLKMFIEKKKPLEFIICEKLRRRGIFHLVIIENSLEYGVYVKAVIGESEFINKLLEAPTIASEFFVNSDKVEWIISRRDEKIRVLHDKERNPNVVLLAGIQSVDDPKLHELLKKIHSEILSLSSRITKDELLLLLEKIVS